jgi:hypothetical protein
MTHLPPFTLPLPEGALPVILNLALVETMEETAGSLYALAADLLAGSAAHSDLLRLLDVVYRHAGCTLDENCRADYLMTLPAARLVTELLAAVLTPLSRIDIAQKAAPPGECPPAQAGF